MDFTREIEHVLRTMLADLFRRVEQSLQPLVYDLDSFMATLFSGVLPVDWRQRWHKTVAEQAAQGFTVAPQTVVEMEAWMEGWAKHWGLLPSDSGDHPPKPQVAAAKSWQASAPPDNTLGVANKTAAPDDGAKDMEAPTTLSSGGVSNKKIAIEPEEIVASATGIPRNTGPNQHRIPGSGKGGYRIPDLKAFGEDRSLALRNSIVEVKGSRDPRSGRLSGHAYKQINDAVDYVTHLRELAGVEKDPALADQFAKAQVEVFSDFPQPTRGQLSTFIQQNVLKWHPIPRPHAMESPIPTAGKPAIAGVDDTPLEMVIPVVESTIASIANPSEPSPEKKTASDENVMID